MTTIYRFTIHNEAGQRIDDIDDEMTEAQLDAKLANCDPVMIGGLQFYRYDGLVLAVVSEEV